VTSRQNRLTSRRALGGSSAIAIAIGVGNVAAYAFTVVAARVLGPRPYGAFAAVLNVLLVASVVTLAMQATAARRVAREPEHVVEVEETILILGRRSALVLGLVFLALSPLVAQLLQLDHVLTAVALAVAIAPTTLMGAQAGILQGERRWTPLAAQYLSAGVSRICFGGLALMIRSDDLGASIGVAVGSFVPVVVGWYALRRLRAGRPRRAASGEHNVRAMWWETVYNSQALLAFLMVSNIDLILARNTLDSHRAGLYAAGLIMVKAVLFLPQFVVVLAFPSMGSGVASRRVLVTSVLVVAAIGICVTVGVRVLSGLALVFVGGHEYAGIQDRLWVFAVLGTLLSMLQLLVYSVLARQARSSILLLWAGLAVVVALGLSADSVTALVTRVVAVDAVVFVLLLATSLRHREQPDAVV
jgi:O-antigen/teichoic acid export membrane protein